MHNAAHPNDAEGGPKKRIHVGEAERAASSGVLHVFNLQTTTLDRTGKSTTSRTSNTSNTPQANLSVNPVHFSKQAPLAARSASDS